MNGFDVAKLVAEKVNAGTFSQTPRAEARAEPLVDPDEFTAAITTSVIWRSRKTEQETKTRRIRVFTIDVAMQRRTDQDTELFSELVTLADEVEDYLVDNQIDGVRRRTSFVGTEAPYILPHLMEHGIATAVVTLEYELKAG